VGMHKGTSSNMKQGSSKFERKESVGLLELRSIRVSSQKKDPTEVRM